MKKPNLYLFRAFLPFGYNLKKGCLLFFWVWMMCMANLHAQRTVGLFQNTEASDNGYTLLVPNSANQFYLIDNCGRVVNEWESNRRNAFTGMLLENGDVARCSSILGEFNSGGSAGLIERFSWEGDILWRYEYNNAEHQQHHDFEVLPNGNFLLLAWESKTAQEAEEAGVMTGHGGTVYSEMIAEVQPFGMDSGRIVWEWHMWDHLVQDENQDANNYGVVSEHHELIHANYLSNFQADLTHCNAIDYSPDLDQIMLSSRNYSEIWVVDHSTTTEQASGHTGGAQNKGGDLLFRWGNPAAYDLGTVDDQRLFGQHDAHWIPSGRPGYGNILVYNNGIGRPGGQAYSTIEEIVPPIDETGYVFDTIIGYGPFQPVRTIRNIQQEGSFFSPRISGAQRLPNGNTLICEGVGGKILEVDESDRLVWKYVNPVSTFGPVNYDSNQQGYSLFRAYRYMPDFPGLSGHDLVPGDVIELNAPTSECEIFHVTQTKRGIGKLQNVNVYYQQSEYNLVIENQFNQNLRCAVFQLNGQLLRSQKFSVQHQEFVLSGLHPGLYIVHIQNARGQLITQKILVI